MQDNFVVDVGSAGAVEPRTDVRRRPESGGPALGRASKERDAGTGQPARNVTAVIDRLPISERQYLLALGGSMWAR